MTSLSSLEACLLCVTVALLLITKAQDVVSTYKYVGEHGEKNPIARWLFERFGLVGGIVIVCIIYLAILIAEISVVVITASPWLVYGTVLVGSFLSYVQYDVARFNRTSQHSVITIFLLRFFNTLRCHFRLSVRS